MTTSHLKHVVVLTAGGLPDRATPKPRAGDLAAADAARHDALAQLSELAGGDTEIAIRTGQVVADLLAAGWQAGHRSAARDHRVVAVYVLDDAGHAARFAEFMTREVDPAYAVRASDPDDELLRYWEQARGRAAG